MCSQMIKAYANKLLTGWPFPYLMPHIRVFFSCLLHSVQWFTLSSVFWGKKKKKFPILHFTIHLGCKIELLCYCELCSLMLISCWSAIVPASSFNFVQWSGWLKWVVQLLRWAWLGWICRQGFFYVTNCNQAKIYGLSYQLQIEQKSTSNVTAE